MNDELKKPTEFEKFYVPRDFDENFLLQRHKVAECVTRVEITIWAELIFAAERQWGAADNDLRVQNMISILSQGYLSCCDTTGFWIAPNGELDEVTLLLQDNFNYPTNDFEGFCDFLLEKHQAGVFSGNIKLFLRLLRSTQVLAYYQGHLFTWTDDTALIAGYNRFLAGL